MALPLPDRFFAQLTQVLAAYGGGQFDLLKGFPHRSVFNEKFEVHLRLAFELNHAFQEGFAIQPNGAAKRVIAIEYRSEPEGQNRGAFEALAHDVGMLQESLLAKISGRDVLADDD